MSYWMAVRRRLAAAALAGIDVAALAITYTGNMTDEIVTMGDGRQYRLLTLTSSGTLSIPAEVKADVWLCGGGANGENGSSSGGGRGGSGGFIAQTSRQSVKNIVCVVGAGNSGASSVSGDVALTADGAMIVTKIPYGYTSATGASGGGGGADNNIAGLIGAGEATYPFGDTTYFNGRPHCPGGGGGAYRDESGTNNEYATGGNGGSNGSNGGNGQYVSRYNNCTFANGGLFGGGRSGGDPAMASSKPTGGSFYGAGGGGGSGRDGSSGQKGAGGYQGVIYVRIPLKQKEAA